MPRHIVKTTGVVLRTRRMGETSKLVTLYTEDRGKLKVTAKGARKPRSRHGAALELFNIVQAVCYIRDERDLQTLTDCDVTRGHGRLLADLSRLAFASAACELVDAVTIEGEPNTRLYGCLTGVLGALDEVRDEQLEPVFWYYQLRVAAALGYRPQLTECVSCRAELAGPWLWFSAAQGGGICPACGPGDGVRLAGPSLRFLARLQGIRTYSAAIMPALPQRAAEIRSALRSFLEYHGGVRGRLRALEFLDGLQPQPSASAIASSPGR
jgi:DNA repair protein RecO (recombination protein O)